MLGHLYSQICNPCQHWCAVSPSVVWSGVLSQKLSKIDPCIDVGTTDSVAAFRSSPRSLSPEEIFWFYIKILAFNLSSPHDEHIGWSLFVVSDIASSRDKRIGRTFSVSLLMTCCQVTCGWPRFFSSGIDCSTCSAILSSLVLCTCPN